MSLVSTSRLIKRTRYVNEEINEKQIKSNYKSEGGTDCNRIYCVL